MAHGDELTYREKCEQLLRENRTMATTIDISDQAFQKAMRDNVNLQGQLAKVRAELQAEKDRSMRLGAEINEAGRVANDEAARLHVLLKKHGINPETGEKVA